MIVFSVLPWTMSRLTILGQGFECVSITLKLLTNLDVFNLKCFLHDIWLDVNFFLFTMSPLL